MAKRHTPPALPTPRLSTSQINRLAAIQSDPELSEILLPAFIGRRLDLIQRGAGDVVVVGSDRSPGTLRVREFLTRNGSVHHVRH